MFLTQLASVLALAAGAAASSAKPQAHVESCYKGETASLYCYNGKDDKPQNVDMGDVAKVAQALRDWGRGIEGGRFLTMTAKDAPDCAEWDIFTLNTVMALAKHVGTNKDSSVLYEDIARTIDGGAATQDEEDDKRKTIMSCLEAGGSLGVAVNKTDPAYHTKEYEKSGYTPDGIVIKIVANVKKVDL
ncbi:hypothetical protein CDD83_5301 [Cordyceps sp. RAO-2017]|nr:hypothetical protein CDD83_5301 [Cordyceps sp. RAO-2017]